MDGKDHSDEVSDRTKEHVIGNYLCRLIVQGVRVVQARMLLPSVSREPTKSYSGGCTYQSHGGRATQSHGAGTPAWKSCRGGTSTLVSSEGRALSQRGLFLSP